MADLNLKPTPKMAATGLAFGPAIVLVWILGQFGVDMPAEVAGAVVASIMWLAGYFKSDRGRHAADG